MAKTMTVDAALAIATARGVGSRDAAFQFRVELDVARWGESSRAASRVLHGSDTHGMLLNGIAVADIDQIDRDLMRAARVLMSVADWRELRDAARD